MDIDPSIYFQPSSPDPSVPTTPPQNSLGSPLPHVNLPALPRPSVSPASTRVSFTQQQKSGRTSAGLDLSASMQQNYSSTSHQVESGEKDPSLEDEVARARSERAARRNLTTSLATDATPTSPTNSSSPSFDPRDNASARDNILNLVSAGQSQISKGDSSAPSLAMFMGGGQKRRVHKVNSEMTEQEREVTEKLEKEMEATRAKWANKSNSTNDENSQTPRGGMSLASLMNRQVGGSSSASTSDEPKRWQPSAVSPSPSDPPIRAHTAPAASPAPQQSSNAAPRSLASAFGSTATGPRLNSSPQTPAEETDGPAHARSGGGYAMPGLARSPVPQQEEQSIESKDPEAELVEPKVFSRPAPSPSLESTPAPGPTSPTKISFPSVETSPSKAAPPPQSSTLGRLRGSSIVAERLKFAEQLQQQSQSPLTSPTKERGSLPTSPEKRRSVLERWGRDQPNVFGGGSNPSSPTKPSSLPTPLKSPGLANSNSPWSTTSGKPISTSPKEEGKQLVSDEDASSTTQKQSSYSKPSWQHAPISVKSSSGPAQHHLEEETPIERKHTRGVALPGLGGTSTPASPTKQKTDPLPSSSSGGVRAAAMKWGRTDSDAQREKLEELKRLKESYGVKVDSDDSRRPVDRATVPPPTRQEAPKKPIEAKPVQPAKSISTPSAQTSQLRKPAPASSNHLVDQIISLAMTPSPSARLSGEVLSLDVFHLNSATDHPHPIEHNHILHTTEILGIVARTAPSSGSLQDVETHVWVWRGKEAEETAKTKERIAKLEKKTGAQVVEVMHRQEPRALVEAFEGQLTICKGLREQFDHLEKRLFIVSSQEDVVFVEETDFESSSLCSGYSAVLSLPGEVYAWLGEGSISIEREACCQFAESMADGRSLSVLAEGEETQWFWQSLDKEDNVEYSSANYWHRRYEHLPSPSLVRISSDSASPVSAVDASSIHLLDGGSLENYILVPESARGNKSEIKDALEAAKLLASKWEERGFEAKTPSHVIVFPSAVPRDLPFLAHSIDFDLLNNGSRPKKMHVYTLEEAEKELV
ncbi:hypothetical protein JCM5350_006422 [Sporobolomyces pararoseus]